MNYSEKTSNARQGEMCQDISGVLKMITPSVDEEDHQSVHVASSSARAGCSTTADVRKARTRVGKTFEPTVKPSKQFRASLEFWPNKGLPVPEVFRDVLEDVKRLSSGQLAKKYPAEYNSHRSRKQQAKAYRIHFDRRFKYFRDWLAHLGPREMDYDTVDKINRAKGYVPGNLRWACKLTQTQNRSVTRWHDLPDGTRITTMQLAARVGVPYQTVYKRLKRGWTVKQLLDEVPQGIAGWRFPSGLTDLEPKYRGRGRGAYSLSRLDWLIEHLKELETAETNVARARELASRVIGLEKERQRFVDQEQRERDAHVDKLLTELPVVPPKAVATEQPMVTERKELDPQLSLLLPERPPDPPATPEELAVFLAEFLAEHPDLRSVGQ